MKTKEVVDELTVKRAITRITYEIIERNKDLNKIVLAGIKTRGVFIAHRIQERLKQLENLSVLLWNWILNLSVMMLKVEKILLWFLSM
ncbi:transcriptional attenuation of the pyrimidine operon/uracil phosphoribosyltransferase (bifunctional protein) [Streptococcus pneumoniae]|nr:transcriptional attenuation of the pyrimidine operon/uracil phosphoribosyltransferase (bifunctional protein) [Streptococcus pneumoniae]